MTLYAIIYHLQQGQYMNHTIYKLISSQKSTDVLLRLLVLQIALSMLYITLFSHNPLLP